MRPMQVATAMAVLSWAASARASGPATCQFDPASATLAVTVDEIKARLLADRATGEIRLDGVACGGATVFNTDRIQVNGGALRDEVALTGNFVPGMTPEADGSSEIEITVALDGQRDRVTVNLGGGPDHQVMTAGGLDIGGDGDEDITTAGTELLIVDGGAGNDVIDASAYDGKMYLHGGTGDDRLTGSDRVTYLFGEDGSDTLYGGGGDDRFWGGPGDDVMYGGPGDDGFYADATADGSDVMRGGDGVDGVSYAARGNAVVVTVGNGLADDGEPGEADSVAADVENAGGGTGADVLIGSTASNSLGGGPGSDDIHGGAGNDSLGGGDGDDHLFGDDGDDFLGGGVGSDYLEGGGGADRFVGDYGIEYGNRGIDTVDYGSRTNAVSVTIGAGADDGEALEADDVGGDIDIVIGGSGSDSLVGSEWSNTLIGGDGNDLLDGAGGADVLDGGPGRDHVIGGDGPDELYGDLGNDILEGGGGNDQLYGGDGDDRLEGSFASDQLYGGNGNDRLDGGGGTDVYFGEAGDDLIFNLDGLAETVDCGDGTADDAEPDPLDTFIGCEL